MPKRPCLESGCGSFAVYRGRCADHSRQREQRIERIGRNVYRSKKWQVTRRYKLSLTPLCEYEGCGRIATDVHHKHGVESDPWSLDGLEALCHSHHSRISRQNQLA